jgi:hypothetical protein
MVILYIVSIAILLLPKGCHAKATSQGGPFVGHGLGN